MRTRIAGGVVLIIAAAAALLVYLSVFIVDPRAQALVLRFGGLVDVVTQPGLYFKLPLIDNVVYIERRILDIDSPPIEINAKEEGVPEEEAATDSATAGKRLVVDAFGRYRITDPLKFYQTAGNVTSAESTLAVILTSAVRRVLGESTFLEVVRDDRADLMGRITRQVDAEADQFGIEVIDVKIRRADLPEANSQAVFQRMQTERQKEATQIRAEGERAARTITSEADRQVTVLVANANRQAEQIRGNGDAERNLIFADAYGRDEAFFSFYRSLQAYREALSSADTRLVISPDSSFFRFFNDPAGAAPGGTAGTAASAAGAAAEAGPAEAAPAEAAPAPAEAPAPAAPAEGPAPASP